MKILELTYSSIIYFFLGYISYILIPSEKIITVEFYGFLIFSFLFASTWILKLEYYLRIVLIGGFFNFSYTYLNFEHNTNFIAILFIYYCITCVVLFICLSKKYNSNFYKNSSPISGQIDVPILDRVELENIQDQFLNKRDFDRELLFKNLWLTIQSLSDLLKEFLKEDKRAVICLDGKWGSGKSSTINILKNNFGIPVSRKFVWIEYTTISYSNIHELINDFLTYLSRSLKKELDVDVDSELGNLANLLTECNNNHLVSFLLSLVQKKTTLLDIQNKINIEIGKAIGSKHFIVVIDDIDRLYPADILPLLRMVCILRELHNVTIILPLNYLAIDNVISNTLGAEYSGFISKVINYRVRSVKYSYLELQSIFEYTLVKNLHPNLSLTIPQKDFLWEKVIENMLRFHLLDLYEMSNASYKLVIGENEETLLSRRNGKHNHQINLEGTKEGFNKIETVYNEILTTLFFNQYSGYVNLLNLNNLHHAHLRFIYDFTFNTASTLGDLTEEFYKSVSEIYLECLRTSKSSKLNYISFDALKKFLEDLASRDQFESKNILDIYKLDKHPKALKVELEKVMNQFPLIPFNVLKYEIKSMLIPESLEARKIKLIAFKLAKEINMDNLNDYKKLNQVIKEICALF